MTISILIYLSLVYTLFVALINIFALFYRILLTIFPENTLLIVNITTITLFSLYVALPVIISPLLIVNRFLNNAENNNYCIKYCLSYMFSRTPTVVLENAKSLGQSLQLTLSSLLPIIILGVSAFYFSKYSIPLKLLSLILVLGCLYFLYIKRDIILVNILSGVVGVVAGSGIRLIMPLTELIYKTNKTRIIGIILVTLTALAIIYYTFSVNVNLYFTGELLINTEVISFLELYRFFIFSTVGLLIIYSACDELRRLISEITLRKIELMNRDTHYDDGRINFNYAD